MGGPMEKTLREFLNTPRQRKAMATVRLLGFSSQDTGSIEVGKRADLIVLNRNLFEIPPTEINETQVEATLFGGKLVYGSLDY